jgi:hypothetical protein
MVAPDAVEEVRARLDSAIDTWSIADTVAASAAADRDEFRS